MSPSSPLHIPAAANRQRTRSLIDRVLAQGGFQVISGASPRQLVWLDEYANDRGLEIRDPGGYLANYDDFLAIAHGHAPGGRRTRLEWTVQLGAPAEPLPAGVGRAIAEYTPEEVAAGMARPEGRILVYAAGAKADATRWVAVDG